MFSQAIPSNVKFLKLTRYLRFDLKAETRRNLLHDKFALDSQLWKSFKESYQFFSLQVQHFSERAITAMLRHVVNSSSTWLRNQTSLG